ncbi:MAG: HAMP domain-containing histidine kinase [Rhodospirillales bacterium]|nr:HAMP domain-containing histidine kinase [Rhodospirillales bacterium]
MTDVALEIIRALVLFGIVFFLWISGRNRFEQSRNGWKLIIAGFGLLLFGSILDISDNFESLNRFVIIGDTETEAFLEKFVGFLGGFVFLAIGLFKWIPGVQALSDLVSLRTQDLEEINEKLVIEIEERKQAEKAKQEFTSTVSHELRTPLTSIKGTLGLIQSGTIGPLPDKLQSMIDVAYANSDRLALLIDDILDMEKIQAGKMELHMEPVDVVSLVEEAIEANKGYGDKHGVTFVNANAVMNEKTLVNGDKNRLMQVLSNLMSNAAKFSPDGEQVELSVTQDSSTFRINVKDNGPGIPEECRGAIFEKFTQVDSSDTRVKGGTGLGLSIAKAIVEQHGGAIDYYSETGGGCRFFFNLPILE